jgi:putative sigma-54 modulation protein
MVLHVAGRGVVVSPALRRRIEAKIAKIDRVLPKIVEARVVVATERYRHLVELTLQAKGATFHVQGAAPDAQAALDQALAHLARQVRRRKDWVTGRKKPRPSRVRARSARSRANPEFVDEAPQVTVRRAPAKPMSLDEALDQLRLRGDGLLVFRNARTRVVNVLRRRLDGTVELVEPGA